MKVFKRNAVIITVMLFVCAAVYLNWSYNNEVEKAASAGKNEGTAENVSSTDGDKTGSPVSAEKDATDGAEDAGGLYYTINSGDADGQDNTGGDAETGSNEYSEYFAKVRLERKQARDEASATLSAVAGADGASQETIDEALKSMNLIASWTAKEAELESLIRAKGFIDCVVYLSEDSATVTVASQEELTSASVAKITDIILSETDLKAKDLTVVKV